MALDFLTRKNGIKVPKIQSIDDYKLLADLVHQDPCWVCKNMYGVDPWRGPSKDEPGQAEILEAIFQERHTKLCIASGHATGKTYLSGVIPNMWFDANPWSYIVVTGAGHGSVKNQLIPRIRKFARLQTERRPTEEWKGATWTVSDNWVLIGISPDQGEVAQGWHSLGNPEHGIESGTLALSDESSHLCETIHRGFLSLLTSDNDCYVQLGNPVSMTGPFADTIREHEARSFHYMRIDSRYTPNYQQGRKVIPGLMTRRMVQEREAELGADSAEFGIRVAGQLPGQGENTLISMNTLEASLAREEPRFEDDAPYRISVDVARSPVGDESVILLVGQTSIWYAEGGVGWREGTLVLKIQRLFARFPDKIEGVLIDANGIGSGAADQCEDLGMPVRRVMFGYRAHNAGEFYNCRAEAWYTMGRALQEYFHIPKTCPSTDGRQIPIYEKMLQMTTLEYDRDPQERIRLERKEAYKKRTCQHSPDWPDALAISFARAVGDPAFPMLQMYHFRRFPFDLTSEGFGKYRWHLKGLDRSDDEIGVLARLTWLSPSGTSACLLIFIDTDQCWYVFDSLIQKDTILQDFWRRASAKCHGLEFEIDLVSGPDDPTGNFEYHTINTLSSLTPNSSPEWVQASSISGRKGLDYLEYMMLSTLSRAPEDPFWTSDKYCDPVNFQKQEQIFFFDRETFDAVFSARKRPRATRDGSDEEQPEGLIADGGPVVRCLRMLSIKGGAYVV